MNKALIALAQQIDDEKEEIKTAQYTMQQAQARLAYLEGLLDRYLTRMSVQEHQKEEIKNALNGAYPVCSGNFIFF